MCAKCLTQSSVSLLLIQVSISRVIVASLDEDENQVQCELSAFPLRKL